MKYLEAKQEYLLKGNHETIEKLLFQGKVIDSKKIKDDITLVQLDNGLLAVFKKRLPQVIKSEVLAYRFSHYLLKLEHTVPPTIEGSYLGERGVYQYYMSSDICDKGRYNFYSSEISELSYSALQFFRFIFGGYDVNLAGIIPWRDEDEKVFFTSVDNESLGGTMPVKYGETLYGKTDVYRNLLDALRGSYTSFYDPDLYARLCDLNEDSFYQIYRDIDYTITERDRNAIVNCYLKSISYIKIAVEGMEIKPISDIDIYKSCTF